MKLGGTWLGTGGAGPTFKSRVSMLPSQAPSTTGSISKSLLAKTISSLLTTPLRYPEYQDGVRHIRKLERRYNLEAHSSPRDQQANLSSMKMVSTLIWTG